MGPPGQPGARWSGFWGFPPFLALVQAVAVAVHLEDMNVVGETVIARPTKLAANTRGGRPAFITAVVRAWMHRQFGLPGPAGKGKAGGERIADLATDMTASGFPIQRNSIDNARRQDARLAAFTTLTET